MVRFVFVLLLVTAGALVIALYLDHRRKREARLDPLRSAFLHGRPLAGHTRPPETVPMAHPGGLRFRVPASWTVEMRGHGRPAVAGPGGDRRIEVEMVRLGGPAGPESVAPALQAGLSGERTVETLPGGSVLVKACAPADGEAGPLVCYEWRLGRHSPAGGIETAVFRLRAPLERAGEVITQSDLATLEREVRAAAFSEEDPRPRPPDATAP